MIRLSGLESFPHLAQLRPAQDAAGPERSTIDVPRSCHASGVTTTPKDLPSQRGETWNDTEAINRHRAMTPSERVAVAIQISRAALRFAHAERVTDDRADVRA